MHSIGKIIIIILSVFIFGNKAMASDNCSWMVAGGSGPDYDYCRSYVFPKEDGTILQIDGETVSESRCDQSKRPDPTKIEPGKSVFCCCPKQEIGWGPDLNPIGNLQVKIPGLDKIAKEHALKCEEDSDGNKECKIPWVAIYITAIYNYLLMIGGILSTIALMIGGVIWLVSAGNASRISEAKSWITGSLTGIIILLTSYVLLHQINPNLVGLRYLELESIKGESGDSWENALAGTAFTPQNVRENANVQSREQCVNMVECPVNNSLRRISEIPTLANRVIVNRGVDDRLGPGAMRALEVAANKAYSRGVLLIITSAFRSQQRQCELWFDLGQDPARVARPGRCTSHTGGTAVDLGLFSLATGQPLNTGGDNRHFRNENTKILYDIMVESGWVRYCGEQWHFQYRDGQSLPCPGHPNSFGHCTIYIGGRIQQAPNCPESMFGKR